MKNKTDAEFLKECMEKARVMGFNLVVERANGGAITSAHYTTKKSVESFRKGRALFGELQFIPLGEL